MIQLHSINFFVLSHWTLIPNHFPHDTICIFQLLSHCLLSYISTARHFTSFSSWCACSDNYLWLMLICVFIYLLLCVGFTLALLDWQMEERATFRMYCCYNSQKLCFQIPGLTSSSSWKHNKNRRVPSLCEKAPTGRLVAAVGALNLALAPSLLHFWATFKSLASIGKKLKNGLLFASCWAPKLPKKIWPWKMAVKCMDWRETIDSRRWSIDRLTKVIKRISTTSFYLVMSAVLRGRPLPALQCCCHCCHSPRSLSSSVMSNISRIVSIPAIFSEILLQVG